MATKILSFWIGSLLLREDELSVAHFKAKGATIFIWSPLLRGKGRPMFEKVKNGLFLKKMVELCRSYGWIRWRW